MRIVNLTPHPITLIRGGRSVTILPSGQVARCVEMTVPVGVVAVDGLDGDDVPLVARQYGPLEGLPAPQAGTVYVVSALAAQAAWATGRTDVVAPADLVRDHEGRVIGATALSAAPQLATVPTH